MSPICSPRLVVAPRRSITDTARSAAADTSLPFTLATRESPSISHSHGGAAAARTVKKPRGRTARRARLARARSAGACGWSRDGYETRWMGGELRSCGTGRGREGRDANARATMTARSGDSPLERATGTRRRTSRASRGANCNTWRFIRENKRRVRTELFFAHRLHYHTPLI